MPTLLPKQTLLDLVKPNASTLAEGLVIGIALVLKSQDIESKQDLKPFKVFDLVKELSTIVTLLKGQREAFKQELKQIWSYGPDRYLSKKKRLF